MQQLRAARPRAAPCRQLLRQQPPPNGVRDAQEDGAVPRLRAVESSHGAAPLPCGGRRRRRKRKRWRSSRVVPRSRAVAVRRHAEARRRKRRPCYVREMFGWGRAGEARGSVRPEAWVSTAAAEAKFKSSKSTPSQCTTTKADGYVTVRLCSSSILNRIFITFSLVRLVWKERKKN